MTDKQIIIEEVKCPWFNDGSCDLFYSDKEECWYRKCKDTPNCYYRETQTQLKRKEQELQEAMDNYVKLDNQRVKEYNELVDKYNNKEQECERLKKKLNPKLKNAHCAYFEGQTGLCKAKEFTKCNPVNCKLYTIDELSTIVNLQQQLDQLKAEVKSKTEYIQEQRDIINQYSKEIEMYKKCQGKRASKREEELKAENEELKSLLKVRIEDLCDSCGASSMKLMPCKVYEKTLAEIKEIAEKHKKDESVWNPYRQLDKILQKISEVEDEQN